jgi:hypothetical protein
VHAPNTQHIAVGEDVFKSAPDLSALLAKSEQELVDEALEQRLEPRVLTVQMSALQAQERSSWSALAPRLDVVANSIGGNPHPRFVPAVDAYNTTWEAGAVLSWTPSDIPAALASSSTVHARGQQLSLEEKPAWGFVAEASLLRGGRGNVPAESNCSRRRMRCSMAFAWKSPPPSLRSATRTWRW